MVGIGFKLANNYLKVKKYLLCARADGELQEADLGKQQCLLVQKNF